MQVLATGEPINRTDPRPLLGPIACSECHSPGLLWYGRAKGWFERRVIGTVQGVNLYRTVRHNCTARKPPSLPKVDIAFR